MTVHTSKPLHSRAILTTEERKMLAMTTKNNPQKPFEAVAQETGLAPELLRKLVRNGVLAGVAPWRVAGVVGTCDIDQAKQIAAQLQQARQSVEGNGILPSEAAEKYKFGIASIYNWHKAGWVTVVGTSSSGDKLYNEGDIAFARALANLSGHKPGKKVFPSKLD